MQKLRAGLLALLCFGAIAGCTTNKSIGNVSFTTKPTLTIAVGSLNDNFSTLGVGGVTLNVVAAFRNQNGVSAFINPGTETLNAPGGPTAVGQVFSYGQAPGANGTAGQPPAYTPANQAGAGYATGYIPTGLATTLGSYSMTAAVPVNGTTATYTSNTATLSAGFTVLGPDGGGSYVPDANGDGGGIFTFAAPPAGVTESVVYISCAAATAPPDPCGNGAGFPVASAEVTGATLTATLPAGTLVAGDAYNAVVLGADYPLVEAGPPANAASAPTLTGAGGTSDLTVSAAVAMTG